MKNKFFTYQFVRTRTNLDMHRKRARMGDNMGNRIIFYWDYFFILNLIMNLFLIEMTGLLRRKYISGKRLLLAALIGSVQMTVLAGVCLFWTGQGKGCVFSVWFLFPAAVFIGWEMLQMVFRERSRRERWHNLTGLLQVSLLTGGTLLFLRERIQGKVSGTGAGLVAVGTAGIFFVFLLGRRTAGRRELESHVMDGILTARNGEQYPLRVLFDSGNGLVSPYTGEAVMIIAREVADQLEVEKGQNPLWIPFHSIGGDGLLPAYRFSSLVLQNGRKKENFLAAVSDELSTDRTIQMIVNGD